jgi:hypothetical protein
MNSYYYNYLQNELFLRAPNYSINFGSQSLIVPTQSPQIHSQHRPCSSHGPIYTPHRHTPHGPIYTPHRHKLNTNL